MGDLPNLVQINTFVLVNEHIPQAGDLAPGDLRRLCSNRLWHTLCRFPHNLEIPNHRVLRFGIDAENSATDRGVITYLLSALKHMN